MQLNELMDIISLMKIDYKQMTNLSQIPGIGPKTEEALKRLNINQISDLLWHFPNSIIHRKLYPSIYDLKEGDAAILKVTVQDIDSKDKKNFSRRKPFKIYCGNSTGKVSLVYFNYHPQYILNWAKVGAELIVIGKIEVFNGIKQIAHPEIIPLNKVGSSISKDEPVYPLTYGITNKQLQKYISFALDKLPNHEEWISPEIIKQFQWHSFKDSLQRIHHPHSHGDLTINTKARKRIAYDELLATQLTINLLRQYKNKQNGRAFLSSDVLMDAFIQNLPFELTLGQKKAINEISNDQRSLNKMSRLLQGDVGCGKTIVAVTAMINAVESGAQAVLMAPTDILANQHFQSLEKLLSKLPIKYALLTGKIKGKERKKIMEELENGKIQILVGTHAIFQETVIFKDLGLVVIDEQHRFGVEQRASLINKGNNADLLVMSATPIPRSLSLALYGDMEITRITEKPKSRIAIKTSIIPKSKLDAIVDSIDHILKDNGKIYWICPLIATEDNFNIVDKLPTKTAAETRMLELEKFYPKIVGLVHGKLDSSLKQENLNKFVAGEYKILVATTVVEVGVDVPDATVIIIENAESFGLSQLHQLRGRVGRGDKASNCILLYNPPISDISWQRLKILRQTDDGFLLAEEDLKLRGSGDIIGTKQSGLPDFRTVDLMEHYELINLANNQAKSILNMDPNLKLAPSRKFRKLLSIFGFELESSIMQ